MIRTHGVPMSDELARNLARGLRRHEVGDVAPAAGLVDLIDRQFATGGLMVTTDRSEARALLEMIDRLSELGALAVPREEAFVDGLATGAR